MEAECRKVEGGVFYFIRVVRGDAKECSNYRSLKMLEHAMKILERDFEKNSRCNYHQ